MLDHALSLLGQTVNRNTALHVVHHEGQGEFFLPHMELCLEWVRLQLHDASDHAALINAHAVGNSRLSSLLRQSGKVDGLGHQPRGEAWSQSRDEK